MANLLQTATQAGSFTTLLKWVEMTDLADTLNSEGPFTLLAPPDAAFAALPQDRMEQLMQDLPLLKRVLCYHVLFGDVRSEDLAETEEAETFEGSIVAIDHTNGIKVNQATVTQADILTDNGVIHEIDAVLIPTIALAEKGL
jgi:uncharacterized surface protein with fasciclin (FAS1) repeats